VGAVAIGDTYATVPELKSRLSIPAANTDFDDELTDALNTASEEIERHCQRQFNKVSAASARSFEFCTEWYTFVDDFYSTAGLVIETDTTGDGTFDTTWASTDYELHPLNNINSGQQGWPFTEIRAVASKRFPVPYLYQRSARVRVTALWGWDNVPAPVKQACLILGAKNFQLKDAPLGLAGSNDFGVVRVQDDRLAFSKLAPYRRNRPFVG
jgi:hypothetical protein